MIYAILGLIVFIYFIRKSNTSDLIKQANMTTEEQLDKFEEAVQTIKSTQFSCLLLAICLISLITVGLIRHTSIELFFMNYFGTGIFRDQVEISYLWYGIPFFSLVIRGIIIQVNIGDYIKKNFDLQEEEINVIAEGKKLLTKPKKKQNTTEEQIIETLEPIVTATPIDTTPASTPQPVATPEPTPQPVAPVNNQTTQQQ